MDFDLLGFLFCIVRKRSKMEEIINYLESRNIFLALLPCWLIIDLKIILHAVNIVLKDFKMGENRAKKPNLELLLRLAGTDQIREAIKFFEIKESEKYVIVVFASKDASWNLDDVRTYLKRFSDAIEVDKYINQCKPCIKRIIEQYRVTREEVRAIKRSYDNVNEWIEKILLERIALALLK
ncbi:MAG: KEOPS complex subunit Cgi121 [Candidatus Njordarchaeales archaeon]